MITHTVSIFEVFWTLIASVGLLLTFGSKHVVDRDLEALKHADDYIVGGPREIIALGRIRTETIKLMTMFGYVLAGVIAMDTPSIHNNPYNHASAAITTVLVLSSFGMVYDTYQYLADRERFLRVWRSARQHHG